MKRMWSKNELKNIANVQAKAVQKDISTLVDKDGHPRFIEGDVSVKSIEGLTKTYAKWSLSGTHLMIVVAGDCDNNAVLGYEGNFARLLDLPKWIKDKIIPQSAFSGTYLDIKTITLYASDNSTQSTNIILRKNTEEDIFLSWGGLTMTADRSFRVSFDLLIDND